MRPPLGRRPDRCVDFAMFVDCRLAHRSRVVADIRERVNCRASPVSDYQVYSKYCTLVQYFFWSPMAKRERGSTGQVIDNLIGVAEAAEIRGVTRSAIWDLITRGKLRTVRKFGRVLLCRDDVLAYRAAKPGRPRKATSNKGDSSTVKK